MIRVLAGIYGLILASISAGWIMSSQEFSLLFTLAVGVGLTSLVLVVGAVAYVSITGKTDISVISDRDDGNPD
jgi:hypothetical protein